MEASRLCHVSPPVADQWPGMTASQSSRRRRVQGRRHLPDLRALDETVMVKRGGRTARTENREKAQQYKEAVWGLSVKNCQLHNSPSEPLPSSSIILPMNQSIYRRGNKQKGAGCKAGKVHSQSNAAPEVHYICLRPHAKNTAQQYETTGGQSVHAQSSLPLPK